MNKIFKSMMAMTIAAFTFTACEDVPEPYNNPYDSFNSGEEVTIDPAGSGTVEDPYNVAAALKLINELGADVNSDKIYVKGYISDLGKGIDATYLNAQFTIADDKNGTNSLLVYRSNYLNDQKFTSTDQLKAGDEVIMCGSVVNYKGDTPEFTTGTYIYSHNGTTSDSGNTSGDNGDGKGTIDSPYNVTAALAAGSGTGVFVKGYIVGSIDGKATTDAKFSAETATVSNILVAASADETDVTKCMPVQLPTGDVRSSLNLVDNAGNYKKEVTLYGNIEKYFSVTGIKSVTYAILNGTEIGTKPESGNTPSGEAKGSGTQADPWNVVAAINAINSGTLPDEAFVKGIIVRLDKFNSTYGSITYWISDSKDGSTKLQVYSGLNLNKEQFTALEDLAIGDEVGVAGKLKDYNGTPEFDKNNYLVSHSNGSNSGNTNTTGTLDNPLTASQAYDAVAAMEKGVTSEADYYVKGKISSIKFTFSAQYGTATFNISDDGATGGKEFIAYSCYYFGNQPWVEGNTQVQVGDEVIVCGKVVNYNGNTPEFASKKNYLVKLNSQTAASRRK